MISQAVGDEICKSEESNATVKIQQVNDRPCELKLDDSPRGTSDTLNQLDMDFVAAVAAQVSEIYFKVSRTPDGVPAYFFYAYSLLYY